MLLAPSLRRCEAEVIATAWSFRLDDPGGAEHPTGAVYGLHADVRLGGAHGDDGLEAVPGDGSYGPQPGPGPASTRQAATSVAPFQLA